MKEGLAASGRRRYGYCAVLEPVLGNERDWLELVSGEVRVLPCRRVSNLQKNAKMTQKKVGVDGYDSVSTHSVQAMSNRCLWFVYHILFINELRGQHQLRLLPFKQHT